MNIERLKKEIDMQTRNGRTEVYIRLADIKELVEGLEGTYGDNRMLIEADYIEELIAEYEEKHKNNFKESLKVNVDRRLVKQDKIKYDSKEIER